MASSLKSEKSISTGRSFLKWRALQSQIMASELSSGREIEGVSVEVEVRRACPSANLGLSIAANTGEARLNTLEETRIDDWLGFPSSAVSSTNNKSPAGSASSSESIFNGVPAVWAIAMDDGQKCLFPEGRWI